VKIFGCNFGLTKTSLQRFSVRYDKGGSEKKFGMFGYGNLATKTIEQLGLNSDRACQLSQISLPSLPKPVTLIMDVDACTHDFEFDELCHMLDSR